MSSHLPHKSKLEPSSKQNPQNDITAAETIGDEAAVCEASPWEEVELGIRGIDIIISVVLSTLP